MDNSITSTDESNVNITKEIPNELDNSITFICISNTDISNTDAPLINNKEINNKKINKIKDIEMPKFDVVILNPPFKGNLHLTFLKKSYNLSKQYIVCVHPATWILDERIPDKYVNIKNLISKNIKELVIFNGNPLFKVGLFVPCVIELIDKLYNDEKIKVVDKINNKIYDCFNIININKWGSLNLYNSIKEKILKNEDTLDNYVKNENSLLDEKNVAYVNLAYLRGHVSMENTTMYSDDAFTFIPRNENVTSTPYKGIHFGFITHFIANNFLTYLKTNFARFCLSIYKINVHWEFKSVPWLDFTQEWTDEKLYKYFDLTQDEINFIEKNIPKYY